MEPAALLPAGGEDLTQTVPEAECAVADGQDRGAHAAALAVAQQVRPGLGGLAVAFREGDEFLTAVDSDAEHDQQAEFRLVQADVQVHAVGPQVDVVDAGQVLVGEGAGLVLPLHGQPGDRRRRQARAGAEELLRHGHEILRRQTV